ncbi:fibrinogen-like YCDxxxxGGGW domain-containing protein [Candidatus Gracilibacteria bacterium]|nr:fibrinogen-like YCDxxxxGGGW domain-containing protein [Candidatus Gracilibacteria bacterium]
MININKKGFTVVELLVAVIIIAILGTVGFAGFTSFLVNSRDANRISQITQIYDGLRTLKIDSKLPMPSDYIEIKRGDKVINYQGTIGKDILKKIDYNSDGYDPKSKDYFSYALTQNKKYFSVLALLEEDPENNNHVAVIKNTIADDSPGTFPYGEGKKVGILLNEDTEPIHTLSSIQEDGEFDILTNTSEDYQLFFSYDEVYSGNGSDLIHMAFDYSCKRVKDLNPGAKNGMYTLDTDGDKMRHSVYCDMERDGGGWTLALKSSGSLDTFEYDSSYWENTTTYNPNDSKYDSLEYKGPYFSELPFTEVMLELVTDGVSEYIVIPQISDSLYELFTNGEVTTDFGREEWLGLIDDAQLQENCNLEGFNIIGDDNTHAQVRIGIIANQEENCDTPDSRIGIGGFYYTDVLSTGNEAEYMASLSDERMIPSFGYIYVR